MSGQLLEDDYRLGVPAAGNHRTQAQTSTSRGHADEPVDWVVLEDAEPALRVGDTDLGRPWQVPAIAEQLTDEDRRRLREEEERQAREELAEAEELLVSDPAISWLGWFAHPLAAAFLVGGAGCLGLFLYTQVSGILATLATQSVSWQIVGYSSLSLSALAVLYSAGRLLLLYIRLQRNRQLRLAGLVELQARTRLRWLAHARAAEARSQLEAYLRGYPLESSRDLKKLATVGVTPELAQCLATARAELLDPAKFTSTVEWFDRFRNTFQSRLDEAAESRVRYWAKRTGIVTALAPNALVDSASSMYFGFAMLADLCTVYNLRAGRTGTAVLLGRVFFQSYLAGQLNEWEKLTEEQLNMLVSPGGPLYELTAARVLSKVGAKAATGALNYFLLGRLGRYACRLLRPVS